MVEPTPAPDGTEGPHCFVADLEHPELAEEDHHHLERVLRTRRGDLLTVSDGAGGWRRCRFGEVLEPLDAVITCDAPAPVLTVAFALVKGQRPELVVQKLTESGVDVIVPFVAHRSVVTWDVGKAERQHERFATIARAAAMQCRRVWLPEIAPLHRFDDVSGLAGAVRADRGGRPVRRTDTTVVVGPEGGFTDAERERLPEAVTLGTTVLRAETAAIAAGVVLTALRAGLIGESSRRAGPPAQYH